MLVLDRKVDQTIVVGGGLVTIRVVRCHGGKVKLGVTAPRDMRIDRGEVSTRRAMEERNDEWRR